MRWLLLILLCTPLSAQTFDASGSRFLSSPHGRTGTWAPYQVALSGLEGLDTVTVRSVAEGVVLEKQVAVAGVSEALVVLPVYVHESARLRVGEEEMQPELPLRRVEPDYARAYTAVFSSDPVYARGVMPSTPTGAICDYYELGEFFTDWRLFDGYDAIVIFNPADVRLPAGSQRAIAEFCSLGGAVLVAGSFRFGESGVNVPPPGEPALPVFRGVRAQRLGYGSGAIYRFGFDDLRNSPSAHLVMADALHDHLWYGATRAPAGNPPTRVPPARNPHPTPLPLDESLPTPLFWALCGGLLLLCGLAPVVIPRATQHRWVTQVVLLAGCAGICGGAMLQETPKPPLEVSGIVLAGQGEAASLRLVVQIERTWGDTLTVQLDGDSRDLPRSTGSRPGWHTWVVDRPLVLIPEDRGEPAVLRRGRIGEQIFRDFATQAHRGGTEFSTGEAFLLDYWLETNAYRGRSAQLAPLRPLSESYSQENVQIWHRGAIRVTALRE